MRNLKNFNHWIAEIRDIAIREVIKNEDGDVLNKGAIDSIFSKEILQNYFDDGLTPQEAFKEETETWEH